MKEGIIVASFGTSYKKTRKLSIEATENLIKENFQDHFILRAFTSNFIIKKLKTRDDLWILNLKEAIAKMKEEGIRKIYIQPLHIIKGFEYGKILRAVKMAIREDQSLRIKIGKPLLSSKEDYSNVIDALTLEDIDGQASVFMGHGTNHESDNSYKKIQDTIVEKGYRNTFIATVEGSIRLEELLPILKEKRIKTVKLKPFMLVAGDHASKDMASDEEDSWKSILEAEGFKVKIDMASLGENKDIRNMFLKHLKELM